MCAVGPIRAVTLAALVIHAVDDVPVPAKNPNVIASACEVAMFVPSAATVRPVPPLIVPSNSAVTPPSIFANGNVALIASPKPPPPALEVAVAVFVPVASTWVRPEPPITAAGPDERLHQRAGADMRDRRGQRDRDEAADPDRVRIRRRSVRAGRGHRQCARPGHPTIDLGHRLPVHLGVRLEHGRPDQTAAAAAVAFAVARLLSPNVCASTVIPFVTDTCASGPIFAFVTAELRISASAVAPVRPAAIETETTNTCASALFDELAVTVKWSAETSAPSKFAVTPPPTSAVGTMIDIATIPPEPPAVSAVAV